MLTALIVDDEPPSREELKALLASAPDVEIIGECAKIGRASWWVRV